MTEEIKSFGEETVDRLNTDTSPYFKPFKYVGGIMLVGGIAIEIVGLFTPAMPVAIVGLSGKLITVGGLLFGGSALTKDPKSEKATDKPTLFGTLKNLIMK
jgi:hypothetical protein